MTTPSPVVQAILTGETKAQWLAKEPLRYLLSCGVAGSYLTIIGFVYWILRQSLGVTPWGKVAASAFFGVGLTLIVFTRSDLFTSNTMYLTVSSLARRTRWAAALRLWVVCYAGNFLGALVVALLLWAAGSLDGIAPDHVLLTSAHHKTALPFLSAFAKGILANWLVCLAVWLNLHMTQDTARIGALVSVVFAFLYLGFEHSIANFGTFLFTVLVDPAFVGPEILRNLAGSTLGNIVGGGLGVGGIAWLLMKRDERRHLTDSTIPSEQGL